ncbi:MAG: hypothetical protein IKW62_00865 [Clostridia bacterium]|nr:hypothetical protein [Clostridia bacterium]
MKKVLYEVICIILALTMTLNYMVFAEGESADEYTVVSSYDNVKLEKNVGGATTEVPGGIKTTMSDSGNNQPIYTISIPGEDWIKIDITQIISRQKKSKLTVKTDAFTACFDDNLNNIKEKKVFFVAQKTAQFENVTIKRIIEQARFEIRYGFVNEKNETVGVDVGVKIQIPCTISQSKNLKVYELEGSTIQNKNAVYADNLVSYESKAGRNIIIAEERILDISGRTLDLQGTISLVFYADLEGVDPQKTKMLFWTSLQSKYTVETAERIVECSGKEKNGYRFEYKNITSKEMTKSVYARLVTTDENGKVEYGAMPYDSYSVVAYAKNMMKNKQLKPLLIKMLNYGAAAQEYFGSNAVLANESLSANERATDFTKLYVSEDKIINENVGKKSDAVIYGTTLSLEGDISINYYTVCNGNYDELGMLFWTESAYNATKTHTIGTETRKVKNYKKNGNYKVFSYENIVSRHMEAPVYARIYTVKNGVYTYSDIKKYSVRDYVARQLAKNDDAKLSKLLRCLMLYGEEANKFFNKKGL